MKAISENHEELRLFLLGGLNDEIRQRIEERLMTESGFLEELEVYEEELIDDYVNNELDAKTRAKFEQHFLCSPDRLQKLKFAVALNRYNSKSSTVVDGEPQVMQVVVTPVEPGWGERLSAFWNAQNWALRGAMSAAVIAMIAIVIWLAIPKAPITVVAVSLSINTSERAEGPPAAKISLPPNADALRITLNLPNPAVTVQNYRIELMDDKGPPKGVEIEARDSQSLTVVIPAAQLARGDYVLRLFMVKQDGTEQRINGSYYFTIL